MKQITITVPDNCELKQNGNTYTIIEKEKKFVYRDVAATLFLGEACTTYINSIGKIMEGSTYYENPNNCTSKRQAEKLLAFNKLMNVAKYLNGDWQPDLDDSYIMKYYIYYSNIDKTLKIDYFTTNYNNIVCFRSAELAQQAIEILGEETIKLALCTDY